MSRFRLDCDVAVRAVDDTAGFKTPTLVSHALDGCYILAGEGHICQTDATVKRIFPDARHRFWNRHACQPAAEAKHTIPDTCHAVRYRHACQPCTIIKRIVPNTRHIGSNFDCLRFFYPDRVIIS